MLTRGFAVSSACVQVDLTKFERGLPFTGDFAASLGVLQQRLAELHLALVVHRKRAIILFEGWEGAGKRRALKALAAALDPCYVATYCTLAEDEVGASRHWLAPFWSTLPEAGSVALHYRSWYRRAVDDKALGRSSPKEWLRACDAINEFENQQTEHGTTIVKLFFHVDAVTQAARLHARGEDPWARHLMTQQDLRSLAARNAYMAAWTDCFAQTDTRWAPWTAIDAGDMQAGVIASLEAVAAALAKAVPAEPPAEGDASKPVEQFA
nr:polyphosphate kinase [Sphingomonas arenae]